MSVNRPRRLPRFSYVGFYRYSVTLCVSPRRSVFVSAAIVDPIRTQLLSTARDHDFAVFVYCFMPDHLHVLVIGDSESSNLKHFVAVFKQISGFSLRRSRGENLWEKGYYDRVLRDDEDTLTVARYILANPLRKRLVERIDAYPFSGSDVLPLAEIVGDVQMMTRVRG